MFDALAGLRDAAEVANGNAQEILRRYRRKPDFSYAASSRIQAEAKAQMRAAARHRLCYAHISIKRIRAAINKGRDGDALYAMDLVQRAVANGPSPLPIFVGQLSYPTAHEAAIALGEAVLDAWQDAGGDDAVERAPDRMHATYDRDDADIAIEASIDLWRRLRRLRKSVPADLWGQIQLEFQVAVNRMEAEEWAADPDNGPSTLAKGQRLTTKPKRSTERGEGRAKLIAALTKHHQYADGGCLNLEPIGNNELARLAGVSDSTASAFFVKQFGGHTKYRAACGDTLTLISSLKLLNQEFAPHHLLGGKPPDEDNRDAES